jgi:hypothetical protein
MIVFKLVLHYTMRVLRYVILELVKREMLILTLKGYALPNEPTPTGAQERPRSTGTRA